MKPSPSLEMKKLNGSPGEALEIREALNELQKQPAEEAASTEKTPESESTVGATEEGKATEEHAESEEGEKAAEQPEEERETAEVEEEEASKTEGEKGNGQG